MNMQCAGMVPAEHRRDIPSIVVGLGARAAATPAEILALVDACLAEIGANRARLVACVTQGDRIRHPALRAAAAYLSVPLFAIDVDAFVRHVPNPSARVARHRGIASVAEAAALACGPLLLEKRVSANATCALARQLYAPESAASAAATLATSRAGS